jgi:glutamine synthetase
MSYDGHQWKRASEYDRCDHASLFGQVRSKREDRLARSFVQPNIWGVKVTVQDSSVGKLDFVTNHKLYNDEQREAIKRIAADLKQHDIRIVRIAWGDQHGIVRAKHVVVHDFLQALRNGIDFQTALLFMDTTNHIIAPIFAPDVGGVGVRELCGGPDAILVPDPLTFKILPWVEKTAWVLGEMYLSDGRPMPFDTRGVLKRQLARLEERGMEYIAGIEVEFYIGKLEDRKLKLEECTYPPVPPTISGLAHGYQYFSDERLDEKSSILNVLAETLTSLGLPLRTMEDEWGPGQCEFTFDPSSGIRSADNVLLFRSAMKQVCRRNGYHVTFMTRPALPNCFASGWHLHQSIIDSKSKKNLFANLENDTDILTPFGTQFVGGALKHAAAACIFAAPTVNGYKRFRPNSFAPDRITWATENRGAMVRVCGGPGDSSSHIENRVGEPCANPYLYMASQIAAGLDGVDNKIDPGPVDLTPYESTKPKLPRTLMEAMNSLREDKLFREQFGDTFVDYYLMVKQSEVNRFMEHVTDWEHQEYFEMY